MFVFLMLSINYLFRFLNKKKIFTLPSIEKLIDNVSLSVIFWYILLIDYTCYSRN